MTLRRLTLASLAASLIWTATVNAGVSVRPSSLELSVERRQGALTVINTSDEALEVRVRTVPWQPDGFATQVDEQQLLDDKALLVFPPIAEIESGRQQTFRVLLRATELRELALFRLQVSWRGARQAQRDSTLAFGLGYSLPLMVTAPDADYRLRYRAVMYQGDLVLEAINLGQRPVYVKAYRWADGSESPVYFYAWPGMRRYFPLKRPGPPPITLQLRTYGWTPSVPHRVDDDTKG